MLILNGIRGCCIILLRLPAEIPKSAQKLETKRVYRHHCVWHHHHLINNPLCQDTQEFFPREKNLLSRFSLKKPLKTKKPKKTHNPPTKPSPVYHKFKFSSQIKVKFILLLIVINYLQACEVLFVPWGSLQSLAQQFPHKGIPTTLLSQRQINI